MSLPPTPSRSIARSNLSTPSTAQHDRSPAMLTPRSKVKAMLAAVDDESNAEQTDHLSKKGRAPLVEVSENISTAFGRESAQPKIGSCENKKARDEACAGEEEDEEEESLFIPRCRMAARLKGQVIARKDSTLSHEESADGDAYARIKQTLLARKSANCKSPSSAEIGKKSLDRIEGSETMSISRHNTPGRPSEGERSSASRPARQRKSSTPGLFVSVSPEGMPTASKQLEEAPSESDSDLGLAAGHKSYSRFLELVAKKRAEREAKQAAEDRKRKEKITRQRSFEKELSRDISPSSVGSDQDETVDRRLTQHSRPTRKASKKAIEEMSRETQRMSRNMQLAHQAKTKKKITKESFFERFNFRTSAKPPEEVSQSLSSSNVASSAPASDKETLEKQTPPTSPIEPENSFTGVSDPEAEKIPVASVAETDHIESSEDLPSCLEMHKQSLDKGKGKAIKYENIETPNDSKQARKTVLKQRPIKIHLPEPSTRSRDIDLDSDDDVEVLPTKKLHRSKLDMFDRLPASTVQEGRSMKALRALAHLDSPEKQKHGSKSAMSLGDMQTSLQRRARQQAADERAAKIAELKSRGIIVQTAEERQRDQAEVEDLLEKARREGEEIMQKEKKAAKKAKIANGEVDDLPDTSDEDKDYEEGQEDDREVELSGSEDEEEGDGSEGDAGSAVEDEDEGDIPLKADESGKNPLLDNEASEDGDDEQNDDNEVNDSSDEEEVDQMNPVKRSRRSKMVIDDDEDEEDEPVLDAPQSQITQEATPTVEVPSFATSPKDFGAPPLGMTQAFAATMANTQTQEPEIDEEQDSLAMLDSVPDPSFPMFDLNDSELVEDSQIGLPQPDTNASKEIELHFTQPQTQHDALENTQERRISATQMSEMPDPTQDVGYGFSSPVLNRFVSEPPSTVDTVLLPADGRNESPIKKRGRLQRPARVAQESIDSDEDTAMVGQDDPESSAKVDAFTAMKEDRKALKAKAAREAFNKKKSEAKDMVEEQAQESEDEYAGLGGASDEDSNEEDEDVNAMMDHGDVNVDERRLAQLYANKERASDEKAVEKLYKDINSGMLRRKRGADFDLSDSEDDLEARRRRKQNAFAKMRKALMADENVGKIAEDPKKSAFFQSIEDRKYDDDFDFLDRPAEESFRVEMDTQEDQPASQSQPQQQPSLPAPQSKPRLPPLQDSLPNTTNTTRPPPTARRTAAPKKPATLAEIRESVSFLTEDPAGSLTNHTADTSSSASEDEPHHQAPCHPRRTPANPIIDRLSLKRAESSAANASNAARLAFHDPSSAGPAIGGGFKVPSLLRRATTSSLSASGADANGISTATAGTERAAGGGEKEFVRRGGGKRSSVNFSAREKERKGVVEGVERRRREERVRVMRGRGLGRLVGGRFEG
ncbi:hypothetical protein ACLMJK_000560 [Lecanora helva]